MKCIFCGKQFKEDWQDYYHAKYHQGKLRNIVVIHDLTRQGQSGELTSQIMGNHGESVDVDNLPGITVEEIAYLDRLYRDTVTDDGYFGYEIWSESKQIRLAIVYDACPELKMYCLHLLRKYGGIMWECLKDDIVTECDC